MQIVYTTSNFKGGIYRAVLAILLGLALLIWPADALKYVVMLIGIVFLASVLLRLLSLPETARNISGVLLP
ncbi:hypothetical protein GKD43_14585 [Odoribacter splanchnicus]|uniref:DUF308 domain-containing protein n=1 Tax=Odoribacter splanchnicus TaxID=28118 RepID=UPI0013A0549D|nr:hypothetical protein [Odoribacter splanchnicus]